jgi:hypothetical protein
VSAALDAAARFATDVWRTLTWRTLLYTGLAGLLLGLPHIVSRFVLGNARDMSVAGLVITMTGAFCIMLAVLIADQAIERGTRPWPTYVLALLAGAVLAGWLQDAIRRPFGLYTFIDRPGVSAAVRDTQMVYNGLSMFLYGFMFVLLYRDHRRSKQAEALTRATELERTHGEQLLQASRLAAMRAEVDPAALLAELRSLKAMYEGGAPSADDALEELIQRLRAKLAPVDRVPGSGTLP